MSASLKASADGTQAIIQVGGVDRATLDNTGKLTVSKVEQSTAQSMVRLNTANGYGSTNTKIRRFTTVVTNQGSDITYTDSETLGAAFTINISGVYAISYNDSFTVGSNSGISLNSSQLTTGIGSIAAGDVIAQATNTANAASAVSASTLYLTAGAVVRAHTAGDSTGAVVAQFTICRVA